MSKDRHAPTGSARWTPKYCDLGDTDGGRSAITRRGAWQPPAWAAEAGAIRGVSCGLLGPVP